MTAKEFIKSDKRIQASVIAKMMWPNNDSSQAYLSNKLAGRRPWTDKDEAKALAILQFLAIDISKLSLPVTPKEPQTSVTPCLSGID